MDISKAMDFAAQGATFGVAAFGAFAFLARTLGRPILYGMLNGRYETKEQAKTAQDGVVKILKELQTDVREVRAVLMAR